MVRPPQYTRRHYERRRAASRTLTSGHSESRIEYTAESLIEPSYAIWAALTTPSSCAPSRSIAARERSFRRSVRRLTRWAIFDDRQNHLRNMAGPVRPTKVCHYTIMTVQVNSR